MAVYVDPLINYGMPSKASCFNRKPSCHLYADSLEELHHFARMIGLKSQWFQDNPHLKHYDLTAGKRALAVANGAIQHSKSDAVSKWKELKANGQ